MPRLRRAAGFLVLGLCAATFGQDDGDLARELPRLRPTEPADAPATFRLQEGFRLVPVAGEPFVADPVAACFDADGRLFVVEMGDYPFASLSPDGRVRMLEDADSDGRFDRASIALDGLAWPTSIVPHDGGFFVATAPDILYVKDTDGDGRFDQRRVAFHGFGTQNVQALVNGLMWGHDGWIYGASGGNGGTIENRLQSGHAPVELRGMDFRFRPDGSAFEAIAGGGQFGQTFDDWGHRFVCSNSNHIRQVVIESRYLARNPALVGASSLADIAADGPAAPVFRISPAEPWRVVRTRQRAADPAFIRRVPSTELVPTGFFTSATGITVYRGSAFPVEYRGDVFIGDVGGNLVHRKRLVPDGPSFRAERVEPGVEFLASTDNWFRPVNFANTPDGTLLVLDMYRETIEHPESIPDTIKAHLDLTSGRERGRIYEIVPERFVRRPRSRLGAATTPGLVEALGDPDAWRRETARRLLVERGGVEAAPLLRALAQAGRTPIARAEALWTLEALGALRFADLEGALSDPDPRLREAAARLAEPFARVDRDAARALAALADDPDTQVRLQAALSLGEVRDRVSLDALARIAARDGSDRWIRTAVLSAIGGRAAEFAEALDARGSADGWIVELGEQIGTEGRPETLRTFLEQFGGPEAGAARARRALLGVARGLARAGASLRDQTELARGIDLAAAFEAAARDARGDGPLAGRLEAIALLGHAPPGVALDALPPLLAASMPTEVQLAAIQALGRLPGDPAGPALVERWRSLSPAVRREAIEALLARPGRIAALLDGLEAGEVAASEIDAGRRDALLAHRDPAIQRRAERLLGQALAPDRAAVLERYREAARKAGDPERGRQVFLRHCATCHQARGEGHAVGPDLATVAARPADDLLLHILDPNREVAPQYVEYVVATADGRTLTGLIADESAASVTLRRAEGATDQVPRAQVETIAGTGRSLMPEGLENELDVAVIADLIGFIQSLAGAGRTP
jgi:putative membrane-bound dehydrogenase-like protein